MHLRPTLLLVGNFSEERLSFPALCASYNLEVTSLGASLVDHSNVSIALIDLPDRDLSPLVAARKTYPGSVLVPCCRFGDRHDFDHLVAAGAFHMLHRPLRAHEVRQTIEFALDALDHRRKPLLKVAKAKSATAAA